ncbi:MAG: hypothetical protein E7262_01560 [Lachnospiraceae bacterium]|nr:hypothetical protein [Lachnospiraceae bacterium]
MKNLKKNFKKYCMVLMCVAMVCVLSGCSDMPYKKGNVDVSVDNNGKGSISQEFEISTGYFNNDLTKVKLSKELVQLIQSSINEELGVTLKYMETEGKLKIKLTLDYDSFADMNSKVNAIKTAILEKNSAVKVYLFDTISSVNNVEVIVAECVNEKLDKLGIAYDMESDMYKYLIARLWYYGEGIVPEDRILPVTGDVEYRDLDFINLDEYSLKAENVGNIVDEKSIDKEVTSILDYYLADICAENLDKIIDVDAYNNYVLDEYIDNYKEYINKALDNEDESFADIIVKLNINSIEELNKEVINGAFEYMGMNVSEELNWYADIKNDGEPYYCPTELIFGIKEVVNTNSKVFVNGTELKTNEDKANADAAVKENNTNNKKDNKEINDITPKTADGMKFTLLVVVALVATMGLGLCLVYRKRSYM